MHLFIQSDPSLIVELLWLWYNRTGTPWTSRWPVVPRSSDESRTPKYIGSGKSVGWIALCESDDLARFYCSDWMLVLRVVDAQQKHLVSMVDGFPPNR